MIQYCNTHIIHEKASTVKAAEAFIKVITRLYVVN